VQFARLHKDDFTAVVWLDARSRGTVTQSLARVYVNLPDVKITGEPQSQKETDNRAKQVLKWLETPGNSKWLLIFDDVPHTSGEGTDDEESYDIRTFFPQVDRGSILITTRLLQAGELGKPRLVERMADGDAMRLLTGASDPIPKEAEDGRHTKADLLRIIRQLDGLPLAIVLANAVMRSTGWSVSAYLHAYEQIHVDLNADSTTLSSGDHKLLAAFLVAFNRTRATDPVAANVLQLLSYFGSSPVYFELLHSGASRPDMPDWYCRIVASKSALRLAIASLEDLALLETDRTRESYSMHALIRHACHQVERMTPAEKDATFRAIALICLGVAASELPPGESHIQQRLTPHVNQMLRLIVEKRPDNSYTPAELKALNELGLFYWSQGKPSQATSMFKAAVAGYEHPYQPEKLNSPSFFLTLHRLGVAYQKQNRFHEAERAFQRALDGYRSLHGPTDISTLELSSCLASCYQSQNKLAEAERLFSQALQGYELIGGTHSPFTLLTLNHLGGVYLAANKPAAAETVFQRALHAADGLHGPNDTSALEATFNLGVLYRSQGRYPEAETMLTRALHGFEKTLAPDHLSALLAVHALALVYKDQNKLAQAETLGRRAVTGLSAVLGESAIQTANAMRDLGVIYRDLGKMTDAARLSHAAFTTMQSALGDGHPDTLSALRDLGAMHGFSGNPMRAEEMCRRALEGLEQSPLGADHVSTLMAVYYLGVALQSQGKAEAETMLGRALAGFETRLGVEHVYTLTTVNRLGEWYWTRRDLDAAARMYRRAATGFERTLGARHVWTLRAMNWLGFVYAQSGRAQEAGSMYRQALTGFEGLLGRDDAETQLVATRLRLLELDSEFSWYRGFWRLLQGRHDRT
jgi:tetratricopeptide (TPR) repeat protein